MNLWLVVMIRGPLNTSLIHSDSCTYLAMTLFISLALASSWIIQEDKAIN